MVRIALKRRTQVTRHLSGDQSGTEEGMEEPEMSSSGQPRGMTQKRLATGIVVARFRPGGGSADDLG